MKIIRLSLNNLASLSGEQSIHFDTHPLQYAGLIAITGKTGAGKSTLLDAMCLALFDQIPRLTGAAGALQDTSGQSILIKDTKHILRRGCINGYAEVEFIALDQKRYLARWEIRRTRNKLDGNLKVDRFVQCLEDERILTQKISECTPCIIQLIGLDFKQFTRSVLLAQSEVGAFLKAKDDQRADLLEYLTNSSIFSQVSQAAFEKTKSYKVELDKIESIIGHIQLLSDEQIAELKQQQQQAKECLKTYVKQQKWHEEHIQQSKKIEQQKQILQQLEQEDISHKKQDLHYLEQFQTIKETYLNIEQAYRKKEDFSNQLQKLNQDDISATYQIAKQHYQTCQKTYNQMLDHFDALKPTRQQAQALDSRRTQLAEEFLKLKSELSNYQTEHFKTKIEENTLKLSTLKKQHQQTQIDFEALHIWHLIDEPKAHIQMLEKYDQLCQLLHGKNVTPILNLEQKVQDTQHLLEQQQQQLYHVQILQRSLEQYDNLLKKHQQQQQQLENLKQQEQTLIQQEKVAHQAYQNATVHLEQVQQVLEQQRHIQLREQLKPNEPCMVCGSLDHPFVTQSMQKLQDQQIDLVLQQKNKCLDEWQNIQTQLKICKTKIDHIQPIDLESAKATIEADLKQTGLNSVDDCHHIEQQLQHTKNTLQDLKDQAKIQEAITKKQEIENTLGSIEDSQQLIQKIKTGITLQTQQKQQEQHIQDLQHTLHTQQYEYKLLYTQQQRVEQALQQIEKEGKENNQTLRQLLEPHTQMQTGKAWLQELEDHKATQKQAFEQAQYNYNQLEQQYLQQQQELTRTKDHIQMWQQQITDYQAKQIQWLQQHPTFTPSIIDFCLHTQDYQALRTEIEKIEYQQQQAQTHLAVLTTQYQQHLLSKPQQIQEEILQEKINEQEQQLENISAQLIGHQHALKQQAEYQQQIQDLQQQLNRWGKISQLIGSSDGAKFKRFAQEHHLDILIEYANQQLQPLAPRYQLQRIPNSLGLAIIDQDMAGEIRPVLSLSGGETFLVSLALALAIANMAAGSMKLESLFIDEGFGTLDPNSLHIVMDALDRLQSQGRKVILISHVQEMHERIPVQIQVQNTSAGASQIKVIG